jgi:glycosyltransferase involved in cell wall biosynthesis
MNPDTKGKRGDAVGIEHESLSSCAVIIPAHNESADVESVIRQIKSRYNFPIVVVDDASTDETASAARAAGANVIPLIVRLGAWGAIQTGLRHACAKGYEYVITMDADGQHEAESISKLIGPVLNGEADVSIGTCVRRGSVLRQIAWVVMKRISGLTLEDITSGFRFYNRAAMEILASRPATLLEYQDVGVLILLQNNGLRIRDVEVEMLPRRSGISRIFHSWSSVAYYMAHTLLLSVTKRRYFR